MMIAARRYFISFSFKRNLIINSYANLKFTKQIRAN